MNGSKVAQLVTNTSNESPMVLRCYWLLELLFLFKLHQNAEIIAEEEELTVPVGVDGVCKIIKRIFRSICPDSAFFLGKHKRVDL